MAAAPEPHRQPRPLAADSPYASPDYFEAEMDVLAESSWHFFCVVDEVASPNDWVRRKVFGVDIFVQNFKGELRGYHNVCQHRGFPIRRAPRGNGIVQCGFHAWTYNQEGIPVGVARNEELFQLSREQKAALALPPVRVATVGRFVFVALAASGPSIEEYLGRYAGLIRTVSSHIGAPRYRRKASNQANWKLCYEVTLDDYHVAFVHPSSGWDIPVWGCVYEREGHHSHLLRRRTADWQFSSFWEDIARGEIEIRGYKIHHLFPNMLLVVATGAILITIYSPQTPLLTEVEDIAFEVAADPMDEQWWEDYGKGHGQVSHEDREVVESQQETIAQFTGRPVLGALEERVGWFLESYEEMVGAESRRRLAARE